MPEPTDEELERRLRADLADHAREPMPEHLASPRISDLLAERATPTPAHHSARRWTQVALGAAAAAIVVVALVVGTSGSDGERVDVGGPGSTTAPSVPTTPTVATTPTVTATTSATTATTTTTTTTAPKADPTVVVDDDFASQAVGTTEPDGWQVATGTWRIAADPGGEAFHYAKSEAGADADSLLVHATASMTDGSVSVRIRTDATAVAGVAVRVKGPADLRACRLDRARNRLVLVAVDGGTSTQLAEIGVDPAGWSDAGLELDASGDQLTCRLTGGPEITTTDPAPRAGGIGLISRGNAGLTQVTVRGTP